MKQLLPKSIVALLLTIISTSAIAQCNYTTGGNGVSKFATTPIIVNGVMTDWSLFLSDADNNTYDNTNGIDLNAPIADAGRDLTRLVITSDMNNLYLYLERAGSTANKVDFLLYMDINNNDLMEQGEPVIQFDWSGSNANVTTSIHNYVPSATSILNVMSANQDGEGLWGTLTPRANLGSLGKGSSDGFSMEVSIPFSIITTINTSGVVQRQLNPGENFKFHASSINGDPSSIPNVNSINDDFGGCVIAPQASSLPVSLLSFQATLKDKVATLNWITTNHYNFSHFAVEKAVDGRNFKEAAIVFAPETSSAENSFKYKDNLQNSNGTLIYYRLKMIDVDGKTSYSETRMVRLTENVISQISTFPNPVTAEVRIMIPAEWQNKLITYEIYSNTGVLVERFENKQAAQIQQLNVQHLNTGNYIIKVSNGKNNSISKFIKQ